MMPRALAFALVLVIVPSAHALDAFPSESQFGATDARILVRLPAGGHLRVETEPPVWVALATTPGGPSGERVRAPFDADVSPQRAEDSWHGLAGTVEVTLHRDDPQQAIEIVAHDEHGGAVFDWPAGPLPARPRGIDAPGILGALGIVATGALLWRARHAK